VYYTFNEAKKLAQDQARQDKADAKLKKAKDNFDLENKRLKEIRAKSYLIKISKEQYREFLALHLLHQYFDGERKEIVSYFNSKSSIDELL
jgi:hypothetical protein